MPVEKYMADSILDTYRNMFREVTEKGGRGESFNKMKDSLNRMEYLAEDCGDITEFTAKLTTENLFIDFSTAYGEVLSALAREEYSEGDGDEKLLEKTLEAYQNAVETLKGKAHGELLIPPIHELIELGRSGISYPHFLRISEEKGLNQALEGSMVVREGILQDIEFSKLMHLPLELKMQQHILEKFDELASNATFGVPNSFEFNLARQKIEWTYQPDIKHWNLVIRIWEKMVENVYDWLDSFGSFAPHDERWVDMRGQSYTMHNIKRTQECNPGILKSREKIFHDYFKLSWDDIFSHDTFINEYQARRVWYSDETLDLIKRAYPYCKPFEKPEPGLIKEAEDIYARKRYKRPDAFQFSDEDKERFIALFGEEKYEEMFSRKSK